MHLIGLRKVSLTESQSKIVHDAHGHFLVRACPGSGKTYTIACKALSDIDAWKQQRAGIAALSFTNAAQDELLRQIDMIRPGFRVRYPHFVGTIDSFINKYIFFPYAYLLGYKPDFIEMIGEPFGRFYSHSVAQSQSLFLKYDLGGNLTALSSARGMSSDFLDIVKKSKASLIKRGKFTQSDANYYAMKILQSHPEIAESLSSRFPFIYLDEAQDTTAIHWTIIKAITDSTNSKQFGVIGDPDQSIYAWNGALPELFTDHETQLAQTKSVFYLNDSRRSSQALCDFYFPLSTLSGAPLAINPAVSTLNNKPTAVYYSKLPEIVDQVRELIESKPGEDKLVLCRSSGFLREIEASLSDEPSALGAIPWSGDKQEPHDLLHAKYELENGEFRSAVKRAERLIFILNSRFDQASYLEEYSFSRKEWYREIESQLGLLPEVDSKMLEQWVQEATQVLPKLPFFKAIELKIKNKRKLDYKNTKARDYFYDYDIGDEEKEIQTVHSAKGKTTEHTFLILRKTHAQLLINSLAGKANLTENKRVLYVAITRASKTLTLCAPIELKAKLEAVLN